MIQLKKKFRFEAAHRLSEGYVGKCANIHGHSWNGEITVEGEKLDAMGMLIDYSEIGKITKLVEEFFDHKLILCDKDPLIDIIYNSVARGSIIQIPGNPTSEVIAQYIYEYARGFIKGASIDSVRLVSVTIEETCTTSCTFTQ